MVAWFLNLIAAIVMAIQMPDLHATIMADTFDVDRSKLDFNSSADVSAKAVTINNCFYGSLRERPDEKRQGWTIVGGLECTSFQRVYSFIGLSLLISLALLLTGFAVRWVRHGFEKGK
jgi:hypothetical protein